MTCGAARRRHQADLGESARARGLDRLDGAFHDQAKADARGQVDYRVLPGHDALHQTGVADVTFDEGKGCVPRGVIEVGQRPVDRLSRAVTSSPRASRASQSVEPMNPAPPVTRTRFTAGPRWLVPRALAVPACRGRARPGPGRHGRRRHGVR